MTRTKGAMRWGANFVGISAALHVVAVFFGGFGQDAPRLLVIALIFAAFAFGLLQRWRWLAYIVFAVVLIETSFVVSQIWAYGPVPGWVYSGIAIANVLTALAVFIALWKTPEPAS